MRVVTKAFGPVEVEERQIISFPGGLLGFEFLRDYALLDAEKRPFYWLQAIEAERVAFVLLDPFLVRPDYEVNIDNEELEKIGVFAPEQAAIFAIVTIPAEDEPMTVNLQGPLVINRDTRVGMQAVLTDPRWQTKHELRQATGGRGPC